MKTQRRTLPIASALACLLTASLFATELVAATNPLHLDGNGRLRYYTTSAQGDKIPDFSFCGYKNGEDITHISTQYAIKKVLAPQPSGDDTVRIQTAIDEIEAMPVNSNGFRGALLLKDGTYRVSSTLWIEKSGVVIRGEGDDDGGTVILAQGTDKYVVFVIEGPNDIEPNSERSFREITDSYVPVGARSFNVASTSGHQVGDEIFVLKRINDAWIKATKNPEAWNPDFHPFNQAYKYKYKRKILAINGNNITIDAPIVDAINTTYGGGMIIGYDTENATQEFRIKQCGIERLQIRSEFNPNETERILYTNEDLFSDEDHAWVGIEIDNAVDCYVKEVTGKYLGYGLVTLKHGAYRVTVQNCSMLEPVSEMDGGRKYSFMVYGQRNLIRDCFSRLARHDFALGQRAAGPNVFYNCTAEDSHNFSEPHLGWGTGTLYDNVQVNGPRAMLNALFRDNIDPGHGWAGANTVFYNCRAPLIYTMKPPTAQNFILGVNGKIPPDTTFGGLVNLAKTVFQTPEGTKFNYKGHPVMGNGYVYSPNPTQPIDPIADPASLWVKQRADRLLYGDLSIP